MIKREGNRYVIRAADGRELGAFMSWELANQNVARVLGEERQRVLNAAQIAEIQSKQ